PGWAPDAVPGWAPDALPGWAPDALPGLAPEAVPGWAPDALPGLAPDAGTAARDGSDIGGTFIRSVSGAVTRRSAGPLEPGATLRPGGTSLSPSMVACLARCPRQRPPRGIAIATAAIATRA